jgi:lambda family phage portal protein
MSRRSRESKGWLSGAVNGLRRFAFGYDAVDDTKKRRKATRSTIFSEDDELPAYKRRKVSSSARDLHRNFSVAGWSIRKHLDYVSTFNFQCRTEDLAFNKRLEKLFAWWALPQNCDIAGRHSLERFVRIAEQSRTIDGDCLVMMLQGGQLQGIESDRIASPGGATTSNNKDNVSGVKVNEYGRATAFCVNRRVAGTAGLVFDQWCPAEYGHLLGYFDRFDQVRGVTRMTAAINAYQDLYEGISYAIAKAKVGQLFGLITYREDSSPLGEYTENAGGDYNISFGGGPFHLDLNPGDKADTLESKTPSVEFQAFVQSMIAMALKALDIPFSFYDESFTNYSGARQALLMYNQSVAAKRGELVEMLDRITSWKIAQWVAAGLISLPDGMRVTELPWEWIPVGMPWIDPMKEASADALTIKSGTRSRQRICKARGEDFFEITDELAAEKKYLEARGLSSDPEQVSDAAATAMMQEEPSAKRA